MNLSMCVTWRVFYFSAPACRLYILTAGLLCMIVVWSCANFFFPQTRVAEYSVGWSHVAFQRPCVAAPRLQMQCQPGAEGRLPGFAAHCDSVL